MDLIKKVVGTLLGAGMGIFGTFIRMGVTAAATYLLGKGYIDTTTASTLTEQLVGAGLALLAAFGSVLNSSVQLNKTPPAK